MERKSLEVDPPTTAKTIAKQEVKKAESNDFQDFFNFGFFNPEDTQADPQSTAISYSYFLKIVPTTYEYLDGKIVTNLPN